MLGSPAKRVSSDVEELGVEDLGLAPGQVAPLRFLPARRVTPLVISFPHVGLRWPTELRPKPQVDFARHADYEVHRLYATASDLGAACVLAVYSRLVVDLNRAPDDITRSVVPDHPAPRPRREPGRPDSYDPALHVDRQGRGVVWATALGNVQLLPEPLTYPGFQQRLRRYHAPYVRALEVLLRRRVRRFGFAVLLDAHSMPQSVGPDLVLGTLDGRSCAKEIEALALAALGRERPGLEVRLNAPYRGGELVSRFGRPDEGIHALQLEVNRGLYMDEVRSTLLPWPAPPSPASASASGSAAGSGAAEPADSRAGTEATAARGTDPSTMAHTVAAAPPAARTSATAPNVAANAWVGGDANRSLAELIGRVTCLVRRLAGTADESAAVGRERDPEREGGSLRAALAEGARSLSPTTTKG
jgi:N-formylglutamate deformylase